MATEYEGQGFPGVGKFTADVQGNRILITVKLKFEALDAQTTMYDEQTNSFVPLNLVWSGSEATEWKAEYKRIVEEFWSGKWKFQKGNEIITPDFRVEWVGAGEHLLVKCQKSVGGSGLFPIGDVHLKHFEDDNVGVGLRAAANVQATDTIITTQYEKIQRVLQPAANISVTRGTPWSVAAESLDALNTLCRFITNIHPNEPMPRLYIEGKSGVTGKADSMVDAVYDHMQRQGVRAYPITKSPTKGGARWFTKSKKQTASVKIRFQENAEYKAADTWKNPYVISLHEFGHCLGLPDEYCHDYGGEIGSRLHDEWKRLCVAAGVVANPCGNRNRSIMSYGWETSGCHYVTVWDALCKITGSDEWRIVKGSA
jgi:hypothetical protein